MKASFLSEGSLSPAPIFSPNIVSSILNLSEHHNRAGLAKLDSDKW